MMSRGLVPLLLPLLLVSPRASVNEAGANTVPSISSAVTVDLQAGTVEGAVVPHPPNHQSYDLAVIRLADDGALVAAQELVDAATCIRKARANPNGAVVLVFIHGWHHNADWNRTANTGDSHFRSFRDLLAQLTRREAERYFAGAPVGGGRRVVGVYLGWDGDPANYPLSHVPGLRHASFYNRYRTAETIGAGAELKRVVKTLVSATKDPLDGQSAMGVAESPLVLAGHSMGALMLESAFLALLKDPAGPLIRPAASTRRGLEIRRAGQLVSFPDAVIALNSAADSTIHKEIRKQLAAQHLSKTIAVKGIQYAPPLLIAATSVADDDTKGVWETAKILSPGHMTDGHDPSLFTHSFGLYRQDVRCDPRGFVDFGQNWHCLRMPEPPGVATPRIPIDLPMRDRTGLNDRPPFARYRLMPIGPMQQPQPTWVFQITPEVVADHNDIFNSRAGSLMLALIQISGAVMSLAEDWPSTFEP